MFALGDAASTTNAKTAAAARKQAPVVAHNLLLRAARPAAEASYDGYGSCPLTVERGKIVLAEFGYGGKLAPSFPKWLIDGTRPSRLAWFLKERMLPPLYWDAHAQGPGMDGEAGNDGMSAAARALLAAACPRCRYCDWGRRYNRDTLVSDLLAALIVTIMLIPQSLAYALLAGLPPEAGLYASIAPLLLYALFGTSRVLAVGPVAVVSLMTATAIGEHAARARRRTGRGRSRWPCCPALMLLRMGLLRLGFLANFLSHPVISGFISASALLIAAGQLKTILGVRRAGTRSSRSAGELARQLPQTRLTPPSASARRRSCSGRARG